MILQVHDELLFEMHESEINYLSMDIKKNNGKCIFTGDKIRHTIDS